MSTRSNIILINEAKENTEKIQIYKHHDGYLFGVGTHLLSMIATLIINNQYNHHMGIGVSYYDKSTPFIDTFDLFIKNLNPKYEVEDYDQLLHSDIEYLYFITIKDNYSIKVSYANRDYSNRQFKQLTLDSEQTDLVTFNYSNSKETYTNIAYNPNVRENNKYFMDVVSQDPLFKIFENLDKYFDGKE